MEDKAEAPWVAPDWRDVAKASGTPVKPPEEMGVVDTIKAKVMPWLADWKTIFQASEQQAPKAPQVSGKVINSHSFETVFSKLIQAESKGQHTDASGKLTTSGKGAKGITQVVRKTGEDPGYGVTPLKDQSKEEYIRFGKDYLKAMLGEFSHDYEKALAAYNAGPGNVKKAITQAERKGGSWKDYLPMPEETLPYIKKILGK